MSASYQAFQFMPPRAGQVLAVTTDTTSRVLDISKLALGGFTPDGAGSQPQEVDLFMQAETDDVYFTFSPTNASAVSKTAADAANPGTPTFGATYAARLVKDALPIRVRIRRGTDKFLNVISGTGGILRIWACAASE